MSAPTVEYLDKAQYFMAEQQKLIADIRGGEMWLVGASISEYAQGNISNHITDRDRKLLLKRSEIDSLYARCGRRG